MKVREGPSPLRLLMLGEGSGEEKEEGLVEGLVEEEKGTEVQVLDFDNYNEVLVDEAVASDCILDIFALFDVLFDAFDTTSDNPIERTTSITMEEEESDPPADNIRIDDDDTPPTTIEEPAEQQQQTRHTQSKDRQVPVISDNNTSKIKIRHSHLLLYIRS